MKYVKRMMMRFLPSCEEAALLASQSMDEPLTRRKRLGMRLHLMVCTFCRRNARQLMLMRELIRKANHSARAGDPLLSSEARSRIARTIAASDSEPSA